MGRKRFRILIGLIAFAHLVAASEFGALIGFAAIWAIIIAFMPIGIGLALIPGIDERGLPAWTPTAVACAVGLAIAAVALRQIIKAAAARRKGEHDEARRRAVLGMSIASVPTCLILSVKALADAWP